MTPEELLAAARRLIERPDAATAGVWPRAAALLTRQALEQTMARRLPLGRTQPRLPLPPLRTGPHRRRAEHMA
jgi:hypothetical protein